MPAEGRVVSLRGPRRWAATALIALLGLGTMVGFLHPLPAFAQDELTRKVKSKVSPAYPEVARKMNISGTVKVMVVVSPAGNVKSTKIVGGHPLLVNAAMDALKKWKFEPAGDDSTGIVEFKFQPSDQ